MNDEKTPMRDYEISLKISTFAKFTKKTLDSIAEELKGRITSSGFVVTETKSKEVGKEFIICPLTRIVRECYATKCGTWNYDMGRCGLINHKVIYGSE